MTDINTLVELAKNSYTLDESLSVGSYVPTAPVPTINPETGFTAQSHYSSSANTLVITYTGTNDAMDQTSNFTISGIDFSRTIPEQVPEAIEYANQQVSQAQKQYGNDVSIVFNGHSLGGYLAVAARHELDIGIAIALNAPGVGAGSTINFKDENAFYYYSNPAEWGEIQKHYFGPISIDSGQIHNVGVRASDNIFFIMEASPP